MISTFDRVVDGEAEARCEFQDHLLRNVLLDERTGLAEQRHGGPLLLGIAEDADEDAGIPKVSSKLNVVDADEAGVAHGNLAAEGFADSALQKLAYALMSMGRHKDILRRSELGGVLLDQVGLDDITNLKLVEAINANAAFHPGSHFINFVLKAPE